MKNRLGLSLLGLLLAAAGPDFGKMNPKWASAPSDTLILNPSEMRKFRTAKRIGEDISNVAVFTSIISVPGYLLALSFPHFILPDRGHGDRSNLLTEGYFSGVVPVLTIAMAAGNLAYGVAARLDTNGTHPVARAWIPYADSTVSIYSLYRFSRNCRKLLSHPMMDPEKGLFRHDLYESSIFRHPDHTVMRNQFTDSRYRLNSLEIRPFSEATSVSAVFGSRHKASSNQDSLGFSTSYLFAGSFFSNLE